MRIQHIEEGNIVFQINDLIYDYAKGIGSPECNNHNKITTPAALDRVM